MSKKLQVLKDGEEVFSFPRRNEPCIVNDGPSEGWRDMLLQEVYAEIEAGPVSFEAGDRISIPFWDEEVECVNPEKSLFKVVRS